MSDEDLEAKIRRQNEAKLREHLERIQRTKGDRTQQDAEEEPGEAPPDFWARWDQWKQAFGGHVLDRSAKEEPIDADFKLLGVKPGATPAEVKKAYYRLAMEHHPDHGGDVEQFQRLMAAFQRVSKVVGGAG